MYGSGDISFNTNCSFINIRNSNFYTALGFEVNIPIGDEMKKISEVIFEYKPYFIFTVNFPKLHNAQLFAQVIIKLLEQKNNGINNNANFTNHELNLN